MPVPNGYQSTKCETISVSNQIMPLNSNNSKSDMLKYGVLLGAATFIVGCIVVLVMENAENKKARKEENFKNSKENENKKLKSKAKELDLTASNSFFYPYQNSFYFFTFLTTDFFFPYPVRADIY
jgi:hypothetical protein